MQSEQSVKRHRMRREFVMWAWGVTTACALAMLLASCQSECKQNCPPCVPTTITVVAPQPESECTRMCKKQFDCRSAPPIVACEVECEMARLRGRVNPYCGTAWKASIACMDELTCSEWGEFQTGTSLFLAEFPCVNESLGIYLYCSGTPEANACLATCGVLAQCDPASANVESCAVKCVRSLQANRLQNGLECWNAAVLLKSCEMRLSCPDIRRGREGNPDGSPCAEQIKLVNESCSNAKKGPKTGN